MKRIISLLTCIILISGTFASPVLALSRDGNGEFSIVLDDLGENVCLHTDVQLSYLNGPVEDVLRYYQANDEDNSRPKAIKFSWETNGPVSGNYTLLLSRSPDMSDPRVFSTAYKSILINNLSADTRYYWTVSANHEGIVYTSEVSTFTTEDRAPNNFFARGITNLRDCGGWPTLDGGRIKYGMLYRCSALSYKDDAYLGEEGKIVMHDVLGIKTEIDLRQRLESGYYGQTASVIGDDVSYYLCAMDGFYEGESHESIRRVFEILSDEANYPVVFHCAIGTDRTGKIAYLTEALLGASDTDTVRDYLLSVLSDVGATRYAGDAAESYKNDVKSYHGTVLSEKAYNYLHEVIGVPTEQLDKIISILKEYPDEVKKPVSTAEEFAAMDPGGAYYLANDITVSSTYKDEFTGIFDGNGRTVTVSVPMFEKFSGKVRDLTIRGEVKAESADLAAFAVSAEGVEAENVKNYANVTLVSDSTQDVTFCAGGIVGKTDIGRSSYFVNCENRGEINAYGFAAGICALSGGAVTLSGCYNYGDINMESAATCGGLLGQTLCSTMVQDSYNFGDIESTAEYTGGLAGYMCSMGVVHKNFLSCGNYGKIRSSGSCVGGICGYMSDISDVLSGTGKVGSCRYCYNLGALESTNETAFVSGLIGRCTDFALLLQHCYSAGELITDNCEHPVRSQLCYLNNYGSDEYIWKNYCFEDSNDPGITLWTEDHLEPEGIYLDMTYGYFEATNYPEMLDGTLCDKLNDKGSTFRQINGSPVTTDVLPSDMVRKGIAGFNGEYYEFNGKGEYVGKADIPEKRFADVSDADYFNKPVLWALWKNITAGTSDTTFSPGAKCTRGQIVTMLWRSAGSPEPVSAVNPFRDVSQDDYYYKAVLWAVERGITSGTSEGYFSPDMTCSRAHAVTFLWVRYGGPAPLSGGRRFSDVSENAYYFQPVAWAVENGVTAGTGADTFSPNADCARGQIVTFLYKSNYRG